MAITLEKQVTIGTNWSNRFINEMVDSLARNTGTSLYITNDDSRQIAMKSVIGLLSGSFKAGDIVKLTGIGDNEAAVNKDLNFAIDLLKGN